MQATEPQITVETAKNLGLTEEEFNNIIKIMGRKPNFTELSIFSAMWSEHCSCKNSIFWLKTLPREGGRLLAGTGEENAGLVDIGDGMACAFKAESHNRPSAIEPYQGAATGVGGIHRDVFTMGARPIAALHSLRFGNIDNQHTRHLMREVARGIGDYGNCFGVPTVGGEVYFEECYNRNILVNAMSVGVMEAGKAISARADEPGSPVFIVGSATGKDGIHGAAFASAGLAENPAENLPATPVGDPFQGKLLMEATLEAIETGAVAGMQDLGAAGIICAAAEMSAKGRAGMRIDLDKVPTRQACMQPFEILLSESQERMLVVGKKGEEHKLFGVFEKRGLECAQVGEVADTGRLEFFRHGQPVADVPAYPLVLGGGAPAYQREYSKPAYLKQNEKFRISQVPKPKDYITVARQLFSRPNIVSKRWIYEQYDSMALANTISANAPSDAALVRLKGSRKALALTMDCNAAYVHADPYVGAMIAVAEAARNITCSGGEPAAATNCLNFGNPYDPEVYWQFVHVVKGIGDACRRFGTPVSGGNVSFYNQSVYQGRAEPVFPTPAIGMLGILDDISTQMAIDFKQEGRYIYMIGTPQNDLGSSEYLRHIASVEFSPAPIFDLDEEYHIQQNLKKLIRNRLLESAHGISEGGLFAALMESAMPLGLGFDIETDTNFRKDAYLFGESQGRILVSVSAESEDALVNHLNSHNVSFTKLGEITGNEAIIDGESFGLIQDWKNIYDHALHQKMES